MTVINWRNTSAEDYTPNWVDDTPWEDSPYNPKNNKKAEIHQPDTDNKILNSFRALGRKLTESCSQTQDLETYIIEEQKKLDIINAAVQEERQKASRITVKILNKEDLTDEDRLFLINKLGQG